MRCLADIYEEAADRILLRGLSVGAGNSGGARCAIMTLNDVYSENPCRMDDGDMFSQLHSHVLNDGFITIMDWSDINAYKDQWAHVRDTFLEVAKELRAKALP